MNEPVPYKIKYEVYPEDGLFIARCLDLDVVSDGATETEALDNLRLAVELYFERNADALIAAMNKRDEDEDEADKDDI
ncbi:MAG: type II toxin-antitoxin system HicB family antitoxin [Bacteroidota bacterium]